MDNTKANENAMKIMNERYPEWINIGCAAHALDLLIKDTGKAKFCPGLAAILDKVKTMVAVIGDCSHVRDLLHKHQVVLYGAVKCIRQHAPTRFATMCMLVSDILSNKAAIKAMRGDDAWDQASSGSENADIFKHVIEASFWRELQLVSQLLQPISQAIHQVEADLPMLSQVYPAWKKLQKHFILWQREPGCTRDLLKGTIDTFTRRFNRHVSGEAVAAYLLDPANATESPEGSGQWNLPFAGIKDEVLLKKAVEVICRITKKDKQSVEVEW